MVSAVVLLNANIGEEKKVLESVKGIQEVEEAKALWGVYDLMVKVKSDSMETLKDTAAGLRNVDGVSNMLALMVMDRP